MGVFDRTCFQSQVGSMRGFVCRAAREMQGLPVYAEAAPGVVKTCPGGKGQLRGSEGQPMYAGVPGRCRGRGVSLPAVTTKAPGSKDRGARVSVSSCYAITAALWSSCSVRFLCCRRLGRRCLCRSLCDLFRRILHYGACSRFIC